MRNILEMINRQIGNYRSEEDMEYIFSYIKDRMYEIERNPSTVEIFKEIQI